MTKKIEIANIQLLQAELVKMRFVMIELERNIATGQQLLDDNEADKSLNQA